MVINVVVQDQTLCKYNRATMIAVTLVVSMVSKDAAPWSHVQGVQFRWVG